MHERPPDQFRTESDVSFPLDLEFHSGMANSVSTDGGGSREGSRDNDKIATQFPSARNPHQNFPQPRRGEWKGEGVQRRNPVFGWPTERSSFVTLNYCTVFARNQESRIERVRTKLSFVIVQQPKQHMGLPHVRAHRKGATACNTKVTVQEATALATPGRSRHHMPSRRVTPRRGIPQIGLRPRRGCEASRRCKWVKPDPSLLMSDALFPLASIPGLEEAPRQTPHASRLKHQPPFQKFLHARREVSPPHGFGGPASSAS